MPSSRRRLIPILLAVLLSIVAAAACGGPSIEGMYSSADKQATLELKAGDQASFMSAGDTQVCTYKRDGTKLTVTCPGPQTFEFTIAGDGSLTSAMTSIGTLKKAAN